MIFKMQFDFVSGFLERLDSIGEALIDDDCSFLNDLEILEVGEDRFD